MTAAIFYPVAMKGLYQPVRSLDEAMTDRRQAMLDAVKRRTPEGSIAQHLTADRRGLVKAVVLEGDDVWLHLEIDGGLVRSLAGYWGRPSS